MIRYVNFFDLVSEWRNLYLYLIDENTFFNKLMRCKRYLKQLKEKKNGGRRLAGTNLRFEESVLTISSDSPSNASFTEDLGNGVTLEMIHIPEGGFWMGSPESEEGRDDTEGPRHRVSVPSFFMGKYLVTQRQWRSVSQLDEVDMELHPDPSDLKGGKRPVECVSWYDTAEFCARLSKHTGKAYRLPSEAEWEYACRAGTITPSHFGARISTDLANINGHYQGTTEVDKFGANAFGLYAMHGNVWEWCLDHWNDNYESAPTDGSAWLSPDEGIFCVYRGGSWGSAPRYCRSACRKGGPPVNRNGLIGFRVCCSAPRIFP